MLVHARAIDSLLVHHLHPEEHIFGNEVIYDSFAGRRINRVGKIRIRHLYIYVPNAYAVVDMTRVVNHLSGPEGVVTEGAHRQRYLIGVVVTFVVLTGNGPTAVVIDMRVQGGHIKTVVKLQSLLVEIPIFLQHRQIQRLDIQFLHRIFVITSRQTSRAQRNQSYK